MEQSPFAGTVPGAGDRAVTKTPGDLPLWSLVEADANTVNKEPDKTSGSEEGDEENSDW